MAGSNNPWEMVGGEDIEWAEMAALKGFDLSPIHCAASGQA